MKKRMIVMGVLLVAAIPASAPDAGAQPAPGSPSPTLSPQVSASINALKPEQARSQYRIHMRRRNIIAAHLNSLWAEERRVKGVIDSSGMAGDMVTVTQQERELYAVRTQIDDLRAQLTRENMILALLEQRMNVPR